MEQYKRVSPPLKWHGGKHYLASKIVALMPPRCTNPNAPCALDPGYLHYVEPYAGGLSVLLANDPNGISEVVGDLHGWLTAFWSVIASEELFPRFQRVVSLLPFSESVWKAADLKINGDTFAVKSAIDAAVTFFVHCRQSHSGRMVDFASLSRNRTRGGMNEQASAWLSAVEGLSGVHERLKRVVVLNRDALDVIRQQDGPKTLYYLDPPYMHQTRATTSEYKFEMTEDQHGELLETIGAVDFKGRFLLSGYHSDLYDDWASACGWKCHEFDLPNNAAGGKSKRRMVECVWTNY